MTGDQGVIGGKPDIELRAPQQADADRGDGRPVVRGAEPCGSVDAAHDVVLDHVLLVGHARGLSVAVRLFVVR
jgi:hypothetical protein